jgi:hypothetical protein
MEESESERESEREGKREEKRERKAVGESDGAKQESGFPNLCKKHRNE